MSKESILWDLEQSTARPASRDRIAKWEATRGVTLPKLLRKVYREHDGGLIRSTQLELYPLEQIVPLADRAWEPLSRDLADKSAFADRSRLLIVGWDNEDSSQFYLNYNECYDDGDPSVWSCQGSGTPLRRVSPSASKYFKKLATPSSAPEVDWDESEQLEILADETVDESSWLPSGTVSRYLLARADDGLVLFRESLDFGTGGKRLTRMALPLPLEPESMILRQRRTDGPWTLELRPRRSEGIVYLESTEIPEVGWRNRRSQGTPTFDLIESESKETLEELRIDLIGERAARDVEAEDDQLSALRRRPKSATPDELEVLGFQLLHAMQAISPEDESTGEVPITSSSHLQHLVSQMQAEVANRGGDEPIPPEVQAMLDQVQQKLSSLNHSDESGGEDRD